MMFVIVGYVIDKTLIKAKQKTTQKKQIWYIRESVERSSCAALREGHLRTQPFRRLCRARFLSAL